MDCLTISLPSCQVFSVCTVRWGSPKFTWYEFCISDTLQNQIRATLVTADYLTCQSNVGEATLPLVQVLNLYKNIAKKPNSVIVTMKDNTTQLTCLQAQIIGICSEYKPVRCLALVSKILVEWCVGYSKCEWRNNQMYSNRQKKSIQIHFEVWTEQKTQVKIKSTANHWKQEIKHCNSQHWIKINSRWASHQIHWIMHSLLPS
jgi:hypothetical protein